MFWCYSCFSSKAQTFSSLNTVCIQVTHKYPLKSVTATSHIPAGETAGERQGKEDGRGKRQKYNIDPLGFVSTLLQTNPKDAILSGNSDRTPLPAGFLCFEVTKCPAGSCSLNCYRMHTADGSSLLQGACRSSWHTWIRKHFFLNQDILLKEKEMWVAWLFFSKPHPKPLQNDKVLLKMKKTTQHRQRKKKKIF